MIVNDNIDDNYDIEIRLLNLEKKTVVLTCNKIRLKAL